MDSFGMSWDQVERLGISFRGSGYWQDGLGIILMCHGVEILVWGLVGMPNSA